jgi:hypothetical protein
LRNEYADLPDVLDYLDAVERDIKENVDDFLPQTQQSPEQPNGPPVTAAAQAALEDMRFRRYQVNIIVDNGGRQGAPVIYEDNPTYQNLLGRVEHLARFGALITDFNLIQAGALHRANGGYLILDAERLIAGGFGWAALKRALQSGEIRIDIDRTGDEPRQHGDPAAGADRARRQGGAGRFADALLPAVEP